MQELRQDYIQPARSKGLPEHTVTRPPCNEKRHFHIDYAEDAGQRRKSEEPFDRENIYLAGLGSYALEAIMSMDLLVIAGITTVMAVIFILINLIVDISYVLRDPRVRLS